MAPKLRLRRDADKDEGGAGVGQEYEDSLRPLPFPSKAWACRLVAGKVSRSPTDPDAPIGALFCGEEDLGPAGRITPTDDLIRQVEGTLGRMQQGLDRIRDEMDVVFKFPVAGRDNDRPRAA